VQEDDHFGISSSVAILRPHTERLNPTFLYYWVAGGVFQQAIYATKGGVAQGYISLEMIRNLPLSVPPLPTQKKIASILSAYDDLIENNNRRIKILEEMAQSIYREWFVNYRLPGHENVRLVDSELGPIPEGWNVRTLGDLCKSITDGDWIESKDQGGSDYRLIQVGNIGMDRFVETNNFRYITEETYRRLNCREISMGDILVSRMPTPIGRAWMVRHLASPMITAVDVAILKPAHTEINPYYLLQCLNSPYNLARAASFATGTTRPRISRRDLAIQLFRVPPPEMQASYGEHCSSMKSLIDLLERKNQNLRQTRDLLLPKLISGELAVVDLDIAVA